MSSSANSRKRLLLSNFAGGPPEKKVATGSSAASSSTSRVPLGKPAGAPGSSIREQGAEQGRKSSTTGAPPPTAAPLTSGNLSHLGSIGREGLPMPSSNVASLLPKETATAGGNVRLQRETGVVESYDKQKGFGFIISDNPPEGDPAKVFVYHTHVKTVGGFRYLKEGAEVSFLRGYDKERDNLPCCLDVRAKDGKSLINNEGVKVERKQLSFGMQNWHNVFQKYPSMRLETSYDKVPKNNMGNDDCFDDVNVPYMGSMFSLMKARFGPDAVKYLKDRFVQGIEVRDPDEFDIEDSFREAADSCEKDYLAKSISKRQADGAEYLHVLFQHAQDLGRPCVQIWTSSVGSCQLLACDATGRVLRLSEPHAATALTAGGFTFEPAKDGNSLGHLTSGFHLEGHAQSIQYKLPSHKVFGARAFKKEGTNLRLDHIPETKHVRTWALKSGDLTSRNSSKAYPTNKPTYDLFLLLLTPELQKWWGGDQQIIDEALIAMRKGRERGELLPDAAVKALTRGAMRMGAPEDLSCMCIIPSWHKKLLESFLEKMGDKPILPEADDGVDMFAM
ncbi:unnamed protein product [Amoebophrya sp. A25]|nr:unnamed protein product [Amoebophrya sp. A25]|eukprot:GSA25T00025558001.1